MNSLAILRLDNMSPWSERSKQAFNEKSLGRENTL